MFEKECNPGRRERTKKLLKTHQSTINEIYFNVEHKLKKKTILTNFEWDLTIFPLGLKKINANERETIHVQTYVQSLSRIKL